MPYKSEAQERLMKGVAHNPEFAEKVGIPQSVGKKFEEHKNDAAGILHHKNGKVLLLKRAMNSSTYPGHWAFAGGSVERDESPYDAAIREVIEETGHRTIRPKLIGTFDSNGVNFHAYVSNDYFEPVLNDEHMAAQWFDIRSLPHPMIPSSHEIIKQVYPDAQERSELDIMKDIRDGVLPSPQKYDNIWLYALRITGSGLAVRGDGEIAFKSPSDYLTNDFLERCNGLPVIWEHPEEKLLDTESFQKQIIGTSCMPYIDGDEVWTVARIYHERAAEMMAEKQLSTSPAVRIGSSAIKHGDLLIEGKPVYLDHVAVCVNGVWDKGEPDGIRLDSTEVKNMDEELLGKIQEMIQGLEVRMDAKHDEMKNRLDALDKAEKKEVEKEIEETKHVVKDDAKSDDDDAKSDAMSCGDDDDKKADAKSDDDDKKADARVDSLLDEISSLKASIASLTEKTSERSIADTEELARAQARADSVAMALGETAGLSPMMGEALMSYRKRLASRFSKFSDRFKNVDISKISDEALFAPIEDAVYADAMTYAKAPPMAEGHVHLIESRDDAGRMVRTPSANSDPRAWMGQFASGAVFNGVIKH